MKDRVEIYESLIALLLQSTRKPPMVAEIFGYIQVAKSRTLLDSLSAFEATFPAVDDDTGHAEKIRELRGELNWYFHMTEEAQLKRDPRRKILALRAESQKRETEFLTLVREHTPAIRRPGGETLSTPLHLQHVRESLSRETLILEYFQVHGRLIVLLINHEETRIIPLGDISPITMLLELLQLQISKLRFHPA
jgi:hypothetical protein